MTNDYEYFELERMIFKHMDKFQMNEIQAIEELGLVELFDTEYIKYLRNKYNVKK